MHDSALVELGHFFFYRGLHVVAKVSARKKVESDQDAPAKMPELFVVLSAFVGRRKVGKLSKGVQMERYDSMHAYNFL